MAFIRNKTYFEVGDKVRVPSGLRVTSGQYTPDHVFKIVKFESDQREATDYAVLDDQETTGGTNIYCNRNSIVRVD